MSTAKGLRRHLEGWQAGLVALLLGGSAILLAAPRAAEPLDWPQPAVDGDALMKVRARDDELAREATKQELDVDVRALGRELRSYNEAAALAEEGEPFALARQRVADAAAKVASDAAGLEKLRAYQLVRFLEELRAWQKSGTFTDEFRALSGDFVEALSRNRWCWPGTRELVLDERALRVLFKKRWNAIVGANGEALALTADEERVRLGFLVVHPFINNDPLGRGVTDPTAVERLVASQRLKTIERLAVLDPAYPAELARGMTLYRTGQFQPAAEAFRRHLERAPDGPHTLRARNYLKAALDQSPLPSP
jgi:hypothetical protein